MAGQPELLEKESAAFANDKPSVRRSRSSLGQVPPRSAKLPEMDSLLEDALVNIGPAEPLTKRESQILRLVISGKTNKEIGRMLCRAERTVEYHRNRLMGKLGAHNAVELVKRAIAMGIA